MSAFYFNDPDGLTVCVSSEEAVSLHEHIQNCLKCSARYGKWCADGEQLRRALRQKNEQLFNLANTEEVQS